MTERIYYNPYTNKITTRQLWYPPGIYLAIHILHDDSWMELLGYEYIGEL